MKKRILIVEDEPEFRKLEREILELMGHEVIEAGDAKEGIETAIREKPDLILMDVRLPCKKRGIGTARILRNNEVTRDIPIIFVTAYLDECNDEVQNVPNCGYITKPFSVRAFQDMIKEYLG